VDFTSRIEAGVAVVSVGGRLDAVTTPAYEQQVQALIDAGQARLVVDFEKLDYISSAGLRGLLVTAKNLKARGGQLRFANVKGPVKAVFDMSGFAAMFTLDDSVDAALAALA